ncbi:MAG: aa3-type cytochrome c oxidase subunit IV [Caulobacteraceae bacterium]
MAGPSDYHRGEMDVSAQASTYHFFMGLTKWGSLVIASSLFFLVLWFCANAGFFRSLIAGVVLLVLGIFALRERKTAGH